MCLVKAELPLGYYLPFPSAPLWEMGETEA